VAWAVLILVLILAIIAAAAFSFDRLTKLLRELRRGGQSALEVNVQFRMFPAAPKDGTPEQKVLPPKEPYG
jgi:hypothetical protein